MIKHRRAIYTVGEPYNPQVPRWPELAEYIFGNGQHELVLFLENPDQDEIDSVNSGPSHLAMVFMESVIFLLYSFDPDIPWGESAYSIHLVPEADRQLPPESIAETESTLNVVLVDAASGIIKAMRTVTLSPDFTGTLHQTVREQVERPFNEISYRVAVQHIYDKFTTAQLRERAIATCTSAS